MFLGNMGSTLTVGDIQRMLGAEPIGVPKPGNIAVAVCNATGRAVATFVVNSVKETPERFRLPDSGHIVGLNGYLSPDHSALLGSHWYNPEISTTSVVDHPVRAVVFDMQYSGKPIGDLPHIEAIEPESLDRFDGFRQPV
jgi:hypothetical protein